jgi:hypothetical protein
MHQAQPLIPSIWQAPLTNIIAMAGRRLSGTQKAMGGGGVVKTSDRSGVPFPFYHHHQTIILMPSALKVQGPVLSSPKARHQSNQASGLMPSCGHEGLGGQSVPQAQRQSGGHHPGRVLDCREITARGRAAVLPIQKDALKIRGRRSRLPLSAKRGVRGTLIPLGQLGR